jgi:hypothetical protein
MFTVQELIALTEDAIIKATNGESKITDEIRLTRGMSGTKCRRFLNNVCSLPGMNYLEIGSWEGSTSISALYQNPIQNYTIVDDWSAGPEDAPLMLSTNYVSLLGYQPNIIQENCFSFDPLDKNINNIDVFFNDIGNSESNQYYALSHYYPSLSTNFVYAINSLTYPPVLTGTNNAVIDNELIVNKYWLIPTSLDSDIVNVKGEMYIAVISKQ